MTPGSAQRVVVGMSGGVDSAVAALLLQQKGYEVIGVFMKNWDDDGVDLHCPAAEDHESAQSVCTHLGIPLHGINFSAQYRERVFHRFLEEYRAGRTPNPDVLCNREIKFKAFLDHAVNLGAAYIATGHYAGVTERAGRFRLLNAADASKDQTYFLYMLDQKPLSQTLFPLAGMLKSDVRDLARTAGLPNHARKDSTGICFIGERDFKPFLARYLPLEPGDIRTPGAEWKGRHDGLAFYTIGQRTGLGIGGPGEPWYVASKNMETNTLYVVQGSLHPALHSRALQAAEVHWIDGDIPGQPLRCRAKTRYRQTEQSCIVTPMPGRAAVVEFLEPQRAVTPGQSVVFYRDGECLGGGIIEHVTASTADVTADYANFA
jgi:tRNA-specific 2-thiouridylase